MMTWGFPCTDISVAGKQKGFTDENNKQTRSGLYYEGIRILRYKKPALSIIENVKNLVSKKFKKEFDLILSDLDEAGYNSYWKVLNAKNYGVPQNRERVFIVSVRKVLDNGKFEFPDGFDNGIRLKDILEDEVDEKYYIKSEKAQNIINRLIEKYLRNDSRNNVNDSNNSDSPQFLGNIYNPNYGTGYGGGVWDTSKICPTLTTMQGGDRQPHIIQNYSHCIDANYFKGASPTDAVKGRRQLVYEYNDISDILNIRIRKLTPKECFRLMGFNDSAYESASKVCSNSQLYKQCGNSIVVDVLYYIFIELYKAMPYLFDDLQLSSFFSGIGAFETALDRLYEGINNGNVITP